MDMEIDYTKHTSLTNGGIKITSFGKGTGDVANTIIDTPKEELLEPLCNKCSKTRETCPFHRLGSAYEECSAFAETKEARNERILNLLKEKKVDLSLLSMVASYQEYKTAKRIANVYNTRRSGWAKALTEEDITLLVEWIREAK